MASISSSEATCKLMFHFGLTGFARIQCNPHMHRWFQAKKNTEISLVKHKEKYQSLPPWCRSARQSGVSKIAEFEILSVFWHTLDHFLHFGFSVCGFPFAASFLPREWSWNDIFTFGSRLGIIPRMGSSSISFVAGKGTAVMTANRRPIHRSKLVGLGICKGRGVGKTPAMVGIYHEGITITWGMSMKFRANWIHKHTCPYPSHTIWNWN